jgi:hypothetical protein
MDLSPKIVFILTTEMSFSLLVHCQDRRKEQKRKPSVLATESTGVTFAFLQSCITPRSPR